MVSTLGKPDSRTARFIGALVLALLWVIAVGPFNGASAQTSQQKRDAMRANSPFNLASGTNTVLQANLVQCGINNLGEVCTDVFDSPTGGGGFWPTGTTNQYIFNSGLQIAGINQATGLPAGWAGDTVGAYFFDARGTQKHGTPLGEVYNALTPGDLDRWPTAGFATDTSLFNAALIGSKTISDQDTYVEYWDGDPARLSGRSHPMGIKVQQRSMAFNAPAGAENTVFFIYKFTNVTNDPTFQSINNAKFGVTLPTAGWTITNIYAAFGMDPDVDAATAGTNFSTGFLPLNMGMAYHAQFTASDFNFASHADLYAPPFFKGPGFVGVKYLQSPINPATKQPVGLTMFSNTTNGAPFPDPVGVKQLFRYLKGDTQAAAGDPVCTIPASIQRRLCALVQTPADTRFYEASGPFSLGPGQSATIVVAYTHGPPVKVAGYTQGATLAPGLPSTHPGLGGPGDTIRTVERIAGLIQVPQNAYVISATDTTVDASKLVPGRDFVPRSLVANALIAQSIFNNKFLLPRPPEAPNFSLIPGDHKVTVVWEPSKTETAGDPYFKIASDPSSPLYDPNYRQFDVEGYVIKRSTGLSGGFETIAVFDKRNSQILDYTGQFDPNFVPELGVPYQTFANNNYGVYPVPVPLNGPIVQYPAGGRVQNQATGTVVITRADTVPYSLSDNGIPFAFVDNNVTNGITYRYTVQAFDVNSFASGAGSLSSPAAIKAVVPVKTALTAGSYTITLKGTTDQTALNPDAPVPSIDPNTGVFSGPMPPTNGFKVSLGTFVPEIATAAQSVAVKIDSIRPGSPLIGLPAHYFLTATGGPGGAQKMDIPVVIPYTGPGLGEGRGSFTVAKGDAAFATKFGLTNAVMPGDVVIDAPSNYEQVAQGRYAINVTNFPEVGPRWFVSGTASVADPNLGCDSPNFTCKPGAPTAGAIAGYKVDMIKGYLTTSSRLRNVEGMWSTVHRAADIEVTWGANGQPTSVIDLTHHVPVAFSAQYGPTYGFLTSASFANVAAASTRDKNNSVITPSDWTCVGPWNQQEVAGNVEFSNCPTATPAVLQPAATIENIVWGPRAGNYFDSTTSPEQGFAMYINGQAFFFIGPLPAAGAKWTLRDYAGTITGTQIGSPVTDANNYKFTSSVRPPNVPGLQAVIDITPTTFNLANTAADLATVHTVPDPYYVRSAFELGPSNKVLRFVNLPTQAVIRIYSLNGTLVRIIEHNDATNSGREESWDLRNRNNQFVASGVYFFVVEGQGGERATGKFTVVQFAR